MRKTIAQMLNEAEPECQQSFINGKPMHECFRKEGECMLCSITRAAYWRGVDDALDGKGGF